VYFAVTTGCFGLGAYCAGRLVVRYGIDRIVRFGAAICFTAGTIVGVLAWAGEASVLAVMAPIALYLLGYGSVVPCVTAAALTPFPQIAGAASSAMGLGQQISATLTALAIAALGANQVAMAIGIFAGGFTVAALALPRRRVV
jgi:DHA1 family bicyclomycin/chloramphenicol resistance-like MFS transporter